MNHMILPIANGCYLSRYGDMYKVRIVCHANCDITQILLENTQGELQCMSLAAWKALKMIPCCLASNGPQITDQNYRKDKNDLTLN